MGRGAVREGLEKTPGSPKQALKQGPPSPKCKAPGLGALIRDTDIRSLRKQWDIQLKMFCRELEISAQKSGVSMQI